MHISTFQKIAIFPNIFVILKLFTLFALSQPCCEVKGEEASEERKMPHFILLSFFCWEEYVLSVLRTYIW